MPGPMPKRSSERTRRNKENEAGLTLKKGVAQGIARWPLPDTSWHSAVVRMYESFSQSGMAAFFEQTDVEMCWIACEGLQAWYDGGKRSANQFEFVMGQFAKLGATEGERRRMRIELDSEAEQQTAEEAEVASIQAFKAKRNVG